MEPKNRFAASPSSPWTLLGLILSIVIPSTGVFAKYLGYPGVVVYVLVVSLVIIVGRRVLFPRLLGWLAGRDLWLAAATFVLLCSLFAVLYPVANSGVVGGGSDRDDALNIAAGELLHGSYPYYRTTYLGNPISPLPGALLLAVPFVLFGNSAYQTLFWLIVFFLMLRACLKERPRSLLLLWLALALSPVALNELITGGDLLANGLYVLVFIAWFFVVVPRADLAVWKKLVPTILLGIGLSSRANFAFLLPLVFAAMARAAGWRRALLYTAITCFTLGLVTIPFLVYDPRHFSPLYTVGELGRFEVILPHAWLVIPLATGLLGLILSFRPGGSDLWALLRRCTVVLAFPVLCGIVLSSLRAGRPDFGFAFFGVAFLFFGTAGFWEGTRYP